MSSADNPFDKLNHPTPWFGIENKDALMPHSTVVLCCGVHYLLSAFVCFLIRSQPPPPPPAAPYLSGTPHARQQPNHIHIDI